MGKKKNRSKPKTECHKPSGHSKVYPISLNMLLLYNRENKISFNVSDYVISFNKSDI